MSRIAGTVSVDRVTAEQVGLRCWRSRLCALPQRPALFAASLRDNLDPTHSATDAQIYAALEQVQGDTTHTRQDLTHPSIQDRTRLTPSTQDRT